MGSGPRTHLPIATVPTVGTISRGQLVLGRSVMIWFGHSTFGRLHGAWTHSPEIQTRAERRMFDRLSHQGALCFRAPGLVTCIQPVMDTSFFTEMATAHLCGGHPAPLPFGTTLDTIFSSYPTASCQSDNLDQHVKLLFFICRKRSDTGNLICFSINNLLYRSHGHRSSDMGTRSKAGQLQVMEPDGRRAVRPRTLAPPLPQAASSLGGRRRQVFTA